MYNTLNYNEGGDKTVIGGVLEIMDGATVIIHEGAIIQDERDGSELPPIIENPPEQDVGASAPNPDAGTGTVDAEELARELQELKDKLQAIKNIIG